MNFKRDYAAAAEVGGFLYVVGGISEALQEEKEYLRIILSRSDEDHPCPNNNCPLHSLSVSAFVAP